jgi:hypothetical protein
MPHNSESRVNFIIERRAKFRADMELLKERQAETREMIRQLVDVTMSLARHGEETDRRLRELGARTDERLRELAKVGVHTDRRLDALIDTVDKLVRRNGPSVSG